MKTVLFACVHNAGRSQMAAAWFNVLADPRKAMAISAGTDPGLHVHPEVVIAMREVGIDLSHATEDPNGKPIGEVRIIRDDVRDRVRALIEDEGWSRTA
jgi:arsenate reductase